MLAAHAFHAAAHAAAHATAHAAAHAAAAATHAAATSHQRDGDNSQVGNWVHADLSLLVFRLLGGDHAQEAVFDGMCQVELLEQELQA